MTRDEAGKFHDEAAVSGIELARGLVEDSTRMEWTKQQVLDALDATIKLVRKGRE